jgi:hypothetical protein
MATFRLSREARIITNPHSFSRFVSRVREKSANRFFPADFPAAGKNRCRDGVSATVDTTTYPSLPGEMPVSAIVCRHFRDLSRHCDSREKLAAGKGGGEFAQFLGPKTAPVEFGLGRLWSSGLRGRSDDRQFSSASDPYRTSVRSPTGQLGLYLCGIENAAGLRFQSREWGGTNAQFKSNWRER